MPKRPIRHRADCPGCGYRHVIGSVGQPGGRWIILPHNAPGGGQCSGTGFPVERPVEPVKGPGPNTQPHVHKEGPVEFIPWPKIARLANETMVVTEKIDGTNACVQIQPMEHELLADWEVGQRLGSLIVVQSEGARKHVLACQSRSRLITPEQDNHGFATWAFANAASLVADLGVGVHFGEWWGAGIQRRYDLDHKRFSLFNTFRWDAKRGHFQTENLDVVPLLYTGAVSVVDLKLAHNTLRSIGSKAAPGFMKPEGVVAYLTATGVSWKITDAVAGPGKHDLEAAAARQTADSFKVVDRD